MLRCSSEYRTGKVRAIRSMHGMVLTKAFMPSVRREVEKMLLSSKKLGTVVETGYCYLNAQCTF